MLTFSVIYEIRTRNGTGFFTVDPQLRFVGDLSEVRINAQQINDEQPWWGQLQEAARALGARKEPFKQRVRIRTDAIDYVLEHEL